MKFTIELKNGTRDMIYEVWKVLINEDEIQLFCGKRILTFSRANVECIYAGHS